MSLSILPNCPIKRQSTTASLKCFQFQYDLGPYGKAGSSKGGGKGSGKDGGGKGDGTEHAETWAPMPAARVAAHGGGKGDGMPATSSGW